MKKSAMFRSGATLFSLIFLMMVSCEKFDDFTNPVLNRYDVPPAVLEMVFTRDIPPDISKVDDFLDRIKQQGMVIHEGNDPPEINNNFSNSLELSFNIGNNCIYDGNNPNNEGYIYGKYEETLRIYRDQNQSNFLADLRYLSIYSPDYPEFSEGMDSGSGMGYVSGEENDFTIFIKVTNGKYEEINYTAIWIFSGTFQYLRQQSELTHVTKCMIMLEKSEDPEDKVANRGTVRIFRDDAPERILR